jgi:hypothetical protein
MHKPNITDTQVNKSSKLLSSSLSVKTIEAFSEGISNQTERKQVNSTDPLTFGQKQVPNNSIVIMVVTITK